MASTELDLATSGRLHRYINAALASAELDAPHANEAETAYTARAVQPAVSAALRDLQAGHGLHHAGDGAAPAGPVPLAGSLFYPDITVSFHAQPLVAVEVKLLRRGLAPQRSIAMGLGQAVIYQGRYAFSTLLLVCEQDHSHTLLPNEVVKSIGSRTGVSIVQVHPKS